MKLKRSDFVPIGLLCLILIAIVSVFYDRDPNLEKPKFKVDETKLQSILNFDLLENHPYREEDTVEVLQYSADIPWQSGYDFYVHGTVVFHKSGDTVNILLLQLSTFFKTNVGLYFTDSSFFLKAIMHSDQLESNKKIDDIPTTTFQSVFIDTSSYYYNFRNYPTIIGGVLSAEISQEK